MLNWYLLLCSYGTTVAYRQLIFDSHLRMSALCSVINSAFLCELSTLSIVAFLLVSAEVGIDLNHNEE